MMRLSSLLFQIAVIALAIHSSCYVESQDVLPHMVTKQLLPSSSKAQRSHFLTEKAHDMLQSMSSEVNSFFFSKYPETYILFFDVYHTERT